MAGQAFAGTSLYLGSICHRTTGAAVMKLDEEQKRVVESNESQICIAGPGSGKTRVLTEKARRLFNGGSNILCLCFTRAAAAEMQSRVPGLPATTIHSYCCGAVGWQVPRGGSNDDGYPYLLHRFLQEQRRDRVRYDWILVDECQDLNPEEMDVALSMVGSKMFAVGDPYQSIYGFQGAMGPEAIRLLEQYGCEKVPLRNNYRSSPEIVSRLNDWFSRGLVSRSTRSTGLTAVLCRRNDDVFEVSESLKAGSVAHKVMLAASASQGRQREWDVLGKSSLRVMTIHASKGHEFDHVILYSWYPDDDEEESRVYYVAMARASKRFVEANSPYQLKKAVEETYRVEIQ